MKHRTALPALALLLSVAGACAPTPRDLQLAAAEQMTPSKSYSSTARAAEEIEKPDEVVPMRVRVYAGAGYRAETVRWRERIKEQFEAASQVTEEQFGFDLKLVQIVEWEPTSDASSMEHVLAELTAHDPADDVDYVIGMTKSLAAFESSLHHLGMAEIFGQHIVLRAMNDSVEREHFKRVFDELTEEEIDRLYLSRLRHKETSVLLHELGHALGAVHTRAPDWMMSPKSSASQHAFGPANTRIVRIAIKLRAEHDTHDAWRRAFVKALQAELDGDYHKDFDPKAREEARKLVEAFLDPESFTRREARQYNRARELMLQNRFEEAQTSLEPLTESRANNPYVIRMSCQIEARLTPQSPGSLALCQRALELLDEDPTPAIFLAYLHLQSNERDKAVEMVEEANRRIDTAETVEANQWVSLGELHAELGSLTLAEAAVDHAPMMVEAKKVREYIEDQRIYFGFKKGVVAAETEADLVISLREASRLFARRDFAGAGKFVQKLEHSHAELAATQAISCQLDAMTGKYKRASRKCRRALEIDENCALARLMSGYLAMSQGKLSQANGHFEAARDLVPRNRKLWTALANFYQTTGKSSALEALRADYQERFGAPLRL